MPPTDRKLGKTTRVKNPASPRLPTVLRQAEFPRDDFEDDVVIRQVRYDGSHLAARDVEAVEIEGCVFSNLRFAGTRMRQSQISDSRIETCDFAEV